MAGSFIGIPLMLWTAMEKTNVACLDSGEFLYATGNIILLLSM